MEEEFVDGISLTELMEIYHPDESQTAAIGAEICRALQALHNKGIIHRDVKPDNVLVTSGGRVVLIDLDAASEFNELKDRDTSLLGTAGYAAPEQFGFARSDVRTDVFGLGVMLNVLLMGEHPSRVLAPGRLRPIIERCIEVNADKRFSNMEELGKKLSELAEKEEVCSECGFITLGGGCLCCCRPSRQRKKRKQHFAVIGGILGLALFALMLLLPGETPPDAPDSPAVPAVTVPPSPVAAAESPVPAPTPSPEAPDMPIYSAPFLWGSHISAPFTVISGGEAHTVYMAAGRCTQNFPNTSDSRSAVLSADEYSQWECGVGFYKHLGGEEYVRIEDAAMLRAIDAALDDSLTLELLAYGGTLPEAFPEYAPHSCPFSCFEEIALQMGMKNAGTYVLRACAEADGTELISEVLLEWNPTGEIRFTYDPALGSRIDQINAFLEKQICSGDNSIIIDLPAGVYEGQILVPADLETMAVYINGEEGATVLRGGVESRSGFVRVTGIRFEGAGISQPEIPAQWPDGRKNIAFFGPGGGDCINCEFQGYDVAVLSTEALKMGTENLFVNNNTAIRIDTYHANGGSGIPANEYRNNGIAIHFKRLNADWPTAWFEFTDSIFADNGIDLQNDLGRKVMLMNCSFFHTVNGAEHLRDALIEEN